MLSVLALIAVQSTQPAAVPEFGKLRAVWMAWPTYDHKRSLPIAPVSTQIIRAIQGQAKVELLVPDPHVAQEVAKKFSPSFVRTHVLDYSELWIRDYGPSFVRDRQGREQVLDFGFNYWGYESPNAPVSQMHDEIDRSVAKTRDLDSKLVNLIGEGGNRESNGAGVLMVTGAVEQQRNPALSVTEIQRRLRLATGAQKILWLPEGLVEDGYSFEGPIQGGVYLPFTTGGHVDNIARFVDERTILLAEVTAQEAKQSQIAAENRRRLEACRRVIEKATDAKGRRFRLVRIPAATLQWDVMKPGDPVYDALADLAYPKGKPFPKGQSIRVAQANSYANFLICNGVVIGSKFGRAGSPRLAFEQDKIAEQVLKRLFPTRKVVLLDTQAVNLGGGGVHCITAHE